MLIDFNPDVIHDPDEALLSAQNLEMLATYCHGCDRADEAEDGCQLIQLSLTHPEAWSLRPLLERLDVEVDVQAGDAAITAQLETPAGRVRLSSLDHVHG